jgi:hypothetical protein
VAAEGAEAAEAAEAVAVEAAAAAAAAVRSGGAALACRADAGMIEAWLETQRFNPSPGLEPLKATGYLLLSSTWRTRSGFATLRTWIVEI